LIQWSHDAANHRRATAGNEAEKSISLEDAAKATHIRAAHLLALEEDRLEDLPSMTQARGFIRLYADYLGLDPLALIPGFQTPVRRKNQRLRPMLSNPQKNRSQRNQQYKNLKKRLTKYNLILPCPFLRILGMPFATNGKS